MYENGIYERRSTQTAYAIENYIKAIIDTKCSKYNENTKKFELTKAGAYMYRMLQCAKDKYIAGIFLRLTKVDTECYYGSSKELEDDYDRVIEAVIIILIYSNPFISTMLKLSEEELKVNA